MSIFEISIVLLFASFAIVAGMVWPMMLNDRINTEAEQLLRTYPSIANADYARILSKEERASTSSGYLIPTAMFTVIVIVGALLMVLDGGEGHTLMRYEVLYGTIRDQSARLTQAMDGLMMMQAAFLGAFLWSLQHLLRRAQARDIGPTTIYRICLYMLFGMVLAIFVNHMAYVTGDMVGSVATPDTRPIAGFFSGYFSIEMFEKVTQWFFGKKKIATGEPPPPLTAIEGIGYDTAIRMQELWIDDAYTLSHINPLEVFLKTPFNLDQCIDWVAQAQLLVAVKNDAFIFLRNHNIRTVLQFEEMMRKPAQGASPLEEFLEKYPFTDEQKNVAGTLKAIAGPGTMTLQRDPSFLRLKQLADLLHPVEASALPPPAPPIPAFPSPQPPPLSIDLGIEP